MRSQPGFLRKCFLYSGGWGRGVTITCMVSSSWAFWGMMKKQCDYLVVSTHLKNMSQIGSWNPNLRDENEKYLKLPPPMWRSGCSESEASPFFVEIAADSESWLKIRVFLCSKSPHANPGSSKHLYESQAWIKNFKKCWTVFSLRCFCFLHW